MLWEQFVSLAKDWTKRLPLGEARAALAALLATVLEDPREATISEMIAQALAEPGPAPEVKAQARACAGAKAPAGAGKAPPSTPGKA